MAYTVYQNIILYERLRVHQNDKLGKVTICFTIDLFQETFAYLQLRLLINYVRLYFQQISSLNDSPTILWCIPEE